jgi:guanylate kinase
MDINELSIFSNVKQKKRIFAICGPSGVGKTTILSEISKHPLVLISKTFTTRPKRNEESDSQYFFITRDEFEAKYFAGEIIEKENIYGYFYGLPSNLLLDVTPNDKPFIFLDVDVNGMRLLRKRYPDQCIAIFITLPINQLKMRLIERGLDNDVDIRLEIAKQRMKFINEFDYLIINQNGMLSSSIETIEAIIKAEAVKVNGRIDYLSELSLV